MKNLVKYIFSMELAAVLLIVLAFAMGMATFIENDFGVSASKALIYNSIWFEVIIGLTFVNLVVNAFKMKPWKTAKWAVFTFHLAFILIILGAGVTRYIGTEGLMSIREGQMSNSFQSDKTYVVVKNESSEILSKKKVQFSSVTNNETTLDFDINNEEYTLHTYEFTPNAMAYIEEGGVSGKPMLELTVRTDQNFQSYSIESGQTINIRGKSIGFDVTERHDINISSSDGLPQLMFPDTVKHFNMMTGIKQQLSPDSLYDITINNLYTYKDFSWVIKNYYPQAALKVVSSDQRTGMDAIHFKITNDQNETIYKSFAFGGSGYSSPVNFTIDGQELSMAYGSKKIELPFSIMLRDFELERYPASNSPSSYSSQVTLIDESANVNMDYKIFMNHVLDYKGYRFFQSSYDTDEKGTVLSVNHDFSGMIVTYLGYALMMLGMFFALFSKKTRFRFLMKKTNVASIILAFILLSPMMVSSQSSACIIDKIPQSQIDELSTLLVQGHSGRFQPYNSISNQVVRKFSRKTSYNGMNSDRILLGMMMNPSYWVKQPLIKVINDDLKDIIGNHDSRATFSDFFEATPNGNSYKLESYIDEAYRKKPSERAKFEKDLITVDERVNVFYMAINKEFLQIFPIPNDNISNWLTPQGPFHGVHKQDSAFVVAAFDYYLQSLKAGQETDDYSDASMTLAGIKQYQKNFMPNYESLIAKRDHEILYNKVGIFDRLFAPYGIFGFVMLIILFIRVLKPKVQMKWAVHILAVLILLTFIAHTVGLIGRWYIAEHAPWSNGYESMIFIGWATILSGLVFYRNSPIALAATSVLTFLIMYVAHLSWMNPEITNLVPVLKSYWLTIHVAIITASYGFLFLGAFMGFLNLIFLIFQTKENNSRIKEKVKEISRINEMTLIVGLYLLTIGTFLGGIWANESWGRYWGWDPKETWALISILLYAFIVHMRFVPGLKGAFAFNFMSVIGYFSILMTYFGVNYYLSGLHSYASGDPMPIPDFVYYALGVIFVIALSAYLKFKKYWNKA